MSALLSASRLHDLEHEHEEGRLQAVDALRKIHDEGLYAIGGYGTWEVYLLKRWDYSKTYGSYLLDFARLRDECKKQGVVFLPENERQVRPIIAAARRKKIDQVHAWQVAVDSAPTKQDVPQVTAQHVESSLAHYGLYRNASPKGDTMAADFKAWLIRGRDLVKRAKMDGHEFVDKYGAKPFPAGFHSVATFVMECAEVAEIEIAKKK